MLVFPQWRAETAGVGCRLPRWAPEPRFAPYVARRHTYLQPQLEEELSSSSVSSSAEHSGGETESGGAGGAGVSPGSVAELVCGWRGCGVRCAGVARLSAHVARAHAHPHSDGFFYCGWRGCTRPQRGFNARYKMLVHVRTHTNERPHECPQCHKSFSRAENLKIHMRSHSGEKPYACPYEGCGKAYSNSSDRFKHTRTHTVDKPYGCKVPGCNKRYTDPSSLRKHVKTYKHFVQPGMNENSSTMKERLQSTPALPTEIRLFIKDTTPINRRYPTEEKTSPVRSNTSPSVDRLSPLNSNSVLDNRSFPMVSTPLLRERSAPVYSRRELYSNERMIYTKSYPDNSVSPLRVPGCDMSYIEYASMYENAYKSYYNSSLARTRMYRTSPCIKLMQEERTKEVLLHRNIAMTDFAQARGYAEGKEDKTFVGDNSEVPLNLKRKFSDSKEHSDLSQFKVRPIEESMEFQLVRSMEMPLDLSNKS